jgi:hypothetical protein
MLKRLYSNDFGRFFYTLPFITFLLPCDYHASINVLLIENIVAYAHPPPAAPRRRKKDYPHTVDIPKAG